MVVTEFNGIISALAAVGRKVMIKVLANAMEYTIVMTKKEAKNFCLGQKIHGEIHRERVR